MTEKTTWCKYCRDAWCTDKPFTVIIPRGHTVEVVFNFCPVCGSMIRRSNSENTDQPSV